MSLSLPIRIAVHLAVLAEISAGLRDYSAENSRSDEELRPREKEREEREREERGDIPNRSQFVAPDTCLGEGSDRKCDQPCLAVATQHLPPATCSLANNS